MGNVVNLNRVRKAQVRLKEAETAVENRVRFGRSKAERKASQDAAERERRRHEDHALTERDKDEKPRG